MLTSLSRPGPQGSLLENLIDDRGPRDPSKGSISASRMPSHPAGPNSCEPEARPPSTLLACQDIRVPGRQPTRLMILEVRELQVRESFRTSSRTEPPLADEVLSLVEHPRSGAASGHLSLYRWAGSSGLMSIPGEAVGSVVSEEAMVMKGVVDASLGCAGVGPSSRHGVAIRYGMIRAWICQRALSSALNG